MKPVANARFMAQQASMLPSSAGNNTHMAQGHHTQHHLGNQMYGSSIPIPPPGLKSATATPVSGGGLFGQSQGLGGTFAGAPGFGNANVGHADDKSDMLREMLRARGAATAAAAAAAAAAGIGGGQAADPGKLDLADPSILHARMQQQSGNPGLGQGLYGAGAHGQGGFNHVSAMYGGGIGRW